MKKRKVKPRLSQPLKTEDQVYSVISPRPSIAELEALVNEEEDVEFEILPNGEVRYKGRTGDLGGKKLLTMRENLGGEY